MNNFTSPVNANGCTTAGKARDTSRYTAIATDWIDNESLSWECRGVLAYLAAVPKDQTTKTQDLIDAGTAGRGMIERILRDLESAGYIVRERGCITLFEEVAQ